MVTDARHWYLGVLHAAGPARVVPVRGRRRRGRRRSRTLSPGRWWPDLDELLADIDRVVPDQVVAATPARDDTRDLIGDALVDRLAGEQETQVQRTDERFDREVRVDIGGRFAAVDRALDDHAA